MKKKKKNCMKMKGSKKCWRETEGGHEGYDVNLKQQKMRHCYSRRAGAEGYKL